MLLEGQIGRKGRCEFTYIFIEGTMLLLIELKFDIRSLTHKNLSNIIAQVCAEADGNLYFSLASLIPAASVYNSTQGLDRAPIQVILTDSILWQFFYFDFSIMCVWRGETNCENGYRSSHEKTLLMPGSETTYEYIQYLKIGNELFLKGLLT
jgi:hypothetical protein